jgi:hypothetical protein
MFYHPMVPIFNNKMFINRRKIKTLGILLLMKFTYEIGNHIKIIISIIDKVLENQVVLLLK